MFSDYISLFMPNKIQVVSYHIGFASQRPGEQRDAYELPDKIGSQAILFMAKIADIPFPPKLVMGKSQTERPRFYLHTIILCS